MAPQERDNAEVWEHRLRETTSKENGRASKLDLGYDRERKARLLARKEKRILGGLSDGDEQGLLGRRRGRAGLRGWVIEFRPSGRETASGLPLRGNC